MRDRQNRMANMPRTCMSGGTRFSQSWRGFQRAADHHIPDESARSCNRFRPGSADSGARAKFGIRTPDGHRITVGQNVST